MTDHTRAHLHLGRLERQISEIVYRQVRATVTSVLGAMPDPTSYSSAPTMPRLLEEKGPLRHREEGRKFVYSPVVPPGRASRSALKNLLSTYFNGSVARAVASLIGIER